MADVTPEWPGWLRGDARRADRAQLFLIGALTLAVLFVALALLLNTAIFTENLATRSTDPGTGQAVAYSEATERAATGLLYRANHDDANGNRGDIEADFESTTANYSDATALHNARDARLSSVTVDASGYTDGRRIEQTDWNRNFTNETGVKTDWTLAENVRVREFTTTVEKSSLTSTTLANALLGTPTFTVKFTNSTGSYSVVVFEAGGNVAVGVEQPDGTDGMCSEPVGSRAVVDVTGRTVNGTHCPALELLGDLPTGTTADPVEVQYRSGDKAVGTYEFTVDDTAGVETDNLANTAGSEPFYTDAVYAADVDVTYRSSEIFFTETVRVAPGEAEES